MFACTIADIIDRFTDAETVIMGDVTMVGVVWAISQPELLGQS